MRVHGSRACDFQEHYTCDNEPWSYGAENLLILKSYIDLRYQLKPYLTSIFQALHESGRMILRPLFMDFGLSDANIPKWTRVNDEGAAANFTTQQYMFGPRLLVAPVTLPNVTTWKVYLPRTSGETNDTKPWTFWCVFNFSTNFVFGCLIDCGVQGGRMKHILGAKLWTYPRQLSIFRFSISALARTSSVGLYFDLIILRSCTGDHKQWSCDVYGL